MTPRHPSEVSAALRQDADGRDAAGDHAWATVLRGHAENCDFLTRELSEAQEATAAKTCAVNAALDVLKVERERAEKAERELSEARAALEKAQFLRAEEHKTRRWNVHATPDGIAICEGDHSSGVSCDEIEYVRKHRLRAAEASLREHAEAIVALRALASEVKETRDAYRRAGSGLHRNRMAAHVEAVDRLCEALSLTTALASRLSAEREAERAVVRAALVVRKSFEDDGWTKEAIELGITRPGLADLMKAVAALPASPSDKDKS
jgi:hypothetical protein